MIPHKWIVSEMFAYLYVSFNREVEISLILISVCTPPITLAYLL